MCGPNVNPKPETRNPKPRAEDLLLRMCGPGDLLGHEDLAAKTKRTSMAQVGWGAAGRLGVD